MALPLASRTSGPTFNRYVPAADWTANWMSNCLLPDPATTTTPVGVTAAPVGPTKPVTSAVVNVAGLTASLNVTRTPDTALLPVALAAADTTRGPVTSAVV